MANEVNFPTTINSHPPDTRAHGADLLRRSALYREFVAEREEILRHKWFESEMVGHDIGFENALVSWVVHHRAEWRKQRPSSGSPI